MTNNMACYFMYWQLRHRVHFKFHFSTFNHFIVTAIEMIEKNNINQNRHVSYKKISGFQIKQKKTVEKQDKQCIS